MQIRGMALFIVVLTILLTTCSGQDYKITQFNSSSGLYYEQIGKVLLSNNNWQFVTSIDYKGYLLFYEYLKQQVTKLEDFCNDYEIDNCEGRLGLIQDAMKHLADIDGNLANFLGLETNSRRTKRDLAVILPFIGPLLQPFAEGLANKIFGNQDMPSLSVYDNQIQELKQGQVNLVHQLNMQSTFFRTDLEKKAEQIEHLQTTQSKIELELKINTETFQKDSAEKERKIATLQSLLTECKEKIQKQKEAQEEADKETLILKGSVKSIQEGMEFLKQQSDQNRNRIGAIEIKSKFEEISSNLNILLSRFQSEQNTFFNVIVNANRGFLDPYIITPFNLIEMMLSALPKLPKGYKFPYHPNFENARKLYNIIEPHFHLYNGTIIWILKMNIVNTKNYNLFKMTSFPFFINQNTLAFIIPQQPFMLTDDQESEHTLVSESDFQISCKKIETGLFLCTRIQTNFNHQSNLDCEVNIFLNKEIDPNQCNIKLISLKEPLFLQLLEYKTWIYAVPGVSDLFITCNGVRKSIALINTGILQLGICNALGKHIFLRPFLDQKIQKVYGNYSTSVTNIKKFIDLIGAIPIPFNKSNILPFNFDDLERYSTGPRTIFRKDMKSNENNQEPFGAGSNIIITITAIVIVGLIMVIILSRNKLKKSGKVIKMNDLRDQAVLEKPLIII